jgi:glutaconate CoA-transferase subunit A
VELPFSAHPTSVYREYDYDAKAIEKYAKATSTRESFKVYLDEYVYGVKDHWEYLEKVGGMKHLNSLKADPILGY